MNKLSIELKKQRREIERLKNCKIFDFKGLGKLSILVFDQIPYKFNEEPDPMRIQDDINDGRYKSIEDFDAEHTADIEFEGEYTGSKIEKYRYQTKLNLIELGKIWKDRAEKEFPDAELTIIVHKQDDEWFLDTFNYFGSIENGIYL